MPLDVPVMSTVRRFIARDTTRVTTARLNVRLQPRARRDEVVGEREGAYVIRVKAPPVDGRANEALIAFVAKRAGVPKGSVTLVRGHASRDKLLRVDGIDEQALRRALTG